MNPRAGRVRWALGLAFGAVALLVLLSTTGPNPDETFTGNIRRLGGPCLTLERWGLFGWRTIGQTETVTQTISGDWQEPSDDLGCSDVEDSLILIRMPPDAALDAYRICGVADDRACLTFRLTSFESSGPGP